MYRPRGMLQKKSLKKGKSGGCSRAPPGTQIVKKSEGSLWKVPKLEIKRRGKAGLFRGRAQHRVPARVI